MRILISSVVLLCSLAIAAVLVPLRSGAGEKGESGPLYKLDLLKTSLGLDVVRKEQKPEGFALLLRFNKDGDVLAVKAAFNPNIPASPNDDKRIAFVCFDGDGVLIEKRYVTTTVGEITGTSGDAFWGIIKDFDPLKTKVDKIEARGPKLPSPK